MPTATAFVPRSPRSCWRVFTDTSMLLAWLPGLRKARVVTTGADGLAREVQFEFAASRTYSLVYTYDEANGEVRWEPHAGGRDAVRGSVKFEARDQGTHVTYELEGGAGPAVRDVDAMAIVHAFAAWMTADQRPSVR